MIKSGKKSTGNARLTVCSEMFLLPSEGEQMGEQRNRPHVRLAYFLAWL